MSSVRYLERKNVWQELGISGFGISITTLEDAYLKLHDTVEGMEEFETDPSPLSSDAGTVLLVTDIKQLEEPGQRAHRWKRLYALLNKRLKHAVRDWRGMVAAVVLPLVFLGVLTLQPGLDLADFAPHYQHERPADPVAYAKCIDNLEAMDSCAYDASYYHQIPTVIASLPS